MKLVKIILRSNKTVFSFKDLALRSRDTSSKNLKAQINYYLKKGDLYHIRRGLYAKDHEYNRFELATKILTPAYVSFETVLAAAGITFQYYSSIQVASYQSRTIECDGTTYVFKKLKSSILTNPAGIKLEGTYSIATPERAFLDVVYLNTRYHFDNLQELDWKKVYEILPIYENRDMEKRVDMYYEAYKKDVSEVIHTIRK